MYLSIRSNDAGQWQNTDARGGRVGAGQCHDDNTKTGDHETGLRWAQKQRWWAQKANIWVWMTSWWLRHVCPVIYMDFTVAEHGERCASSRVLYEYLWAIADTRSTRVRGVYGVLYVAHQILPCNPYTSQVAPNSCLHFAYEYHQVHLGHTIPLTFSRYRKTKPPVVGNMSDHPTIFWISRIWTPHFDIPTVFSSPCGIWGVRWIEVVLGVWLSDSWNSPDKMPRRL